MKKTFQTTGEIISGLVDSKSGLNLKKPFQKAGEIFIEKVKKIFQTTGEIVSGLVDSKSGLKIEETIPEGWKNIH